jgi:hypothetical protein
MHDPALRVVFSRDGEAGHFGRCLGSLCLLL